MVEIYVLNYNGGWLLDQTLRSILGQTYAAKKVILSDNGSTDLSVKSARQYEPQGLEIRVRNPGTGDCYSHYNVCLRETKSPYVAIFHSDDLYESMMVEKQIAFLEAHPDIDAVLTAGVVIGQDNKALWPMQIPKNLKHPVLDRKEIFEYTLRHGNSFFICPSAMFRTSIFERIGMLRAELPYCGDLEMWMRILFRGRGLGYLNEPLIRYRMSLGQGSSVYEQNRMDQSEFFTMMDSYLEQTSVSAETRLAYDALRNLDLFQAGLNQLARRGDSELFKKHLNWLQKSENRVLLRDFGGLDRLKILGATVLAPWAESAYGQRMALALVKNTDPRSTSALRWFLKAKRMLASLTS